MRGLFFEEFAMATVPTDKDLTLMAFTQRVSTPASCLKHLEAIRWREGEFCPKCEFVGQRYRLRDSVLSS